MASNYGVRPISNPLAMKPIDRSFDEGAVPSFSSTERGLDALFSCEVTFPETTSNGCIFEMGGSGAGTFLGTRENGSVLRLRAGDGGTKSQSDNEAAILDITNFPNDNLPHVLVWELRTDPGRVRLWIDGRYKGQADTTTGDALYSNSNPLWAGSDNGGYGVTDDVPNGETTDSWTGNVVSSLHYYGTQLLGDS